MAICGLKNSHWEKIAQTPQVSPEWSNHHQAPSLDMKNHIMHVCLLLGHLVENVEKGRDECSLGCFAKTCLKSKVGSRDASAFLYYRYSTSNDEYHNDYNVN